MVSAGNGVVFAPHPATTRVSQYALQLLNRAIVRAGGPHNLLTTVAEPSIAAANELFDHPDVGLVSVTGGSGVVARALKSNKRVIAAGPGNPPAVVDETAPLQHAAQSIIKGAQFDNNLLCVAEKETIVVEQIAEPFIAALKAAGAIELSGQQVDCLSAAAFHYEVNRPERDSYAVNRELIGRDAKVLAAICGISVSDEVRLLFGESNSDSPFVQHEQMMPFMPIVRVADVQEAIDLAVAVEHGFRHTAIMHSLNVENLCAMERTCATTIFVKNAPSSIGLGIGGEGFLSFTVASYTGDGITTAASFTRQRRSTIAWTIHPHIDSNTARPVKCTRPSCDRKITTA